MLRAFPLWNALIGKKKTLKLDVVEVSEKDADEFADINALHGAIARAISLHHFGSGFMNPPTKDGKLDWPLGEATRAIKKSTGADFYSLHSPLAFQEEESHAQSSTYQP